MNIRPATPDDIPLIHHLAHIIWPPTYRAILSKDQLEYMLNLFYTEKSLQKQMQNGHVFILAYDQEEAVGFASFSLIKPGVFNLNKIYVLPSQQGKGTGRFLIDHIINEIKNQGASILQLYVNRQNIARTFYEKIGFVVTREEDTDIGNGYFMIDYVMEKKL